MTGSINSAGQFSLSGSASTSINLNNIPVDESVPGARIVADTIDGLANCITSIDFAFEDEDICGCLVPSISCGCCELEGLFGDCIIPGCCSTSCGIADSCFYCYPSGGTNSHGLNLGSVNLAASFVISNAEAKGSVSASYIYNGQYLGGASGTANIATGEVCGSVESGKLATAAGQALGIGDLNLLSVGSFNACVNL